MGIGPRLEFRQSQSLVMTPQLRQAIKLLQFSNLEVVAYVEEELERNPLLERDDSAESIPERAALDQQGGLTTPLDAVEGVGSEQMHLADSAPLDMVEQDADKREEMLTELLAEFSISHLRRTPALALSGGERRRVEIARALATGPSYILLDEPLAGIDPIAVGEIRDLVAHLKHRGLGVLITDHNVRETLEIIDRAYILYDGQVLMEGTPDQVVPHEDVRRVYLGEKFSL